uniref:Uncharacterized protein n=1 Tax=Oryza brachyantha TaxID=4533 RepID=J3M5U0_ORYBR
MSLHPPATSKGGEEWWVTVLMKKRRSELVFLEGYTQELQSKWTLRSSARSRRTWRRKNWSLRLPFFTATAPGVPKSASTRNVTWYVVVLAFPCFDFLPPLSAASALSLPFLVSARTPRPSPPSQSRKPPQRAPPPPRHRLTVIDLGAAEQAERGGPAGRRQPEVVGDHHRAIDDDVPRLRRRRRRAPVPQLRAEGHLHRS